MFITQIVKKIIRHPLRWQENRLRKKIQKKKKAIYSSLEKEKMKKLAALFHAIKVIN